MTAAAERALREKRSTVILAKAGIQGFIATWL